MEHVIKVRPIKVSAPKAGLEALFGNEVFVDKDEQKMPDACNYYAIPERKPHLRSFIRSFEWNCVTNEIELTIYETPAFSAYDWIASINENKQDCITLVLMEQSTKEVARIKFTDLKLVSHRCGLTAPKDDDSNDFQPVSHMVFLKYASAQYSKFNHDVDSVELDPDGEWSVTDKKIQVEEISV
jgi:hypothetical protein